MYTIAMMKKTLTTLAMVIFESEKLDENNFVYVQLFFIPINLSTCADVTVECTDHNQ